MADGPDVCVMKGVAVITTVKAVACAVMISGVGELGSDVTTAGGVSVMRITTRSQASTEKASGTSNKSNRTKARLRSG